MKRLKFLFFVLAFVALGLPTNNTWAYSNNTVTWDRGYKLPLLSVAAVDGGTLGITLEVTELSQFDYYELDVASLRLRMLAGSKIYLKSFDRKLFSAPSGYPATVCTDEYSSFSYEATSEVDFTITFADGGNCPAVVKAEEPIPPVIEQIDATKLDQITVAGLTKKLNQSSKTHFVLGNIVETIEILSVGATEAKIKLSTPAKEINLTVNKEKTVDTDADSWNDLSLTLNSTSGGVAELVMKMMEPVKVGGVDPGDLVKIAGNTAVYYVGADSQLYVFPNDKVYFSWYADFEQVKTISTVDMARFSLGGLITYRPGLKMVKFATNNDVYVISQGGVLRKLRDEAMAKELYGDDWNKKIDDINDAFYFSYTLGDTLISVNEYSKESETVLSPNIGVDRGI